MKKFAFNVISSATLLATAAVPVVATVAPIAASAATDSRVSTVPTVSDDNDGVALGQLTLQEDSDFKGDLQQNKTFTLTFPSGVKIANTFTAPVVDDPATQADETAAGVQNLVYIWDATVGDYVALPYENVKKTGDYTVDVTLPASLANHYLTDGVQDKIQIRPVVNLDGVSAGDVQLTVDAFDSGITGGKYTVATVANGDTTTEALDTKTIGDGLNSVTGAIRTTENSLQAISDGKNVVTYKLPADFNWNAATEVSFLAGLNGVNNRVATAAAVNAAGKYSVEISGRTLTLTFNAPTLRTQRGIIQVTPHIDTTSDSQLGDVTVSLAGDVDDSDVVVGTYADYGVTLDTDGKDAETLVAGRLDADDLKLAPLHVKENVADSIVDGRRTTVTFPSWVKVVGYTLDNVSSAVDQGKLEASLNAAIDGTDNKVEFAIPAADSAGKREFDIKFKVSVQADKTGDIVANVDGNAGVTGQVTLGKAVSPISVTAVANPVKVGLKDQAIGDITIAENDKEYLKEGDVTVTLDDVDWSEAPTVKVTDGNAEIDADSVNVDGNVLTFHVKSESTKASKIVISDGKLDLSRSVPYGNITAEVGGSALVFNNEDAVGFGGGGNAATLDAGEFDKNYVVKPVVAKVVTPADQNATSVTKFTIGSTTYNVDGVDKTLDVAPYTVAGRTYLPIRFVANAVGVTDDNIIWNDATKTVTLIKDSRVVTFKVGQSSYTLNGAVVPMDAAAQFKDNRNMIPLRYAAQALGVAIGWDDATQTATVGQ